MSKLFTESNAVRLEELLKDLVSVLNQKRQSILDKHSIGELEVDIIAYLMEQEQKKMKEVGEYFKIKLSTLTSTIDKLEKAKLVKRKNSKDDRRVIFIRPTAKGQDLLESLADLTKGLSEDVIKETPSNDLTPLLDGLGRIYALAKTE